MHSLLEFKKKETLEIDKIYFSCIALLFCMIATAQKPANKNSITTLKKELVEITQPSIRSVYVMSNYFNDGIQKELLKQITEEQFVHIKNNCNEDKYPDCIKELVSDDAVVSNSDDKEDNPFKKLKLYRIATFDNIRNGENFSEESVLVVPAAENKNIDGPVVLQMIFTSSFIQEVSRLYKLALGQN